VKPLFDDNPRHSFINL
jgi:very-long-chain (3R)-3-hydroxyacyl-CoA dehydratase